MRKFSEEDWGVPSEGYMGIGGFNGAADKDSDDEFGGGTVKPPPDKKP